MNSTEFIRVKQNIETVYSYIKDIEEQDRDNPHGDGFYKFQSQLNALINFTNDNESIFIDCIDKQNKDIHPFDEICKKVIDIIYNGSYQKIMSIFIGFDDKDRATNLSVLRKVLERNYSLLISIINELDRLWENKIITAFKVLKKISSYDKTLIILGANGSGKTSFANFLRDVDRNIKVIPASKPIKAVGGVQYIYNSTIDTYQSELFSKKELEVNLLQKLIIGICTEHDKIARSYYDTERKDKSSFVIIKEIFEEFFDIELDDSEFSNKKIMAKKKGCSDIFEFNSMSDGERVAFFYIATAIVAPEKSFIVVDEPETHLNPAIYNKIWDRLIKERTDCQFIFISHTMEFINARTDFELVKIKNFIYPDHFEFEFFGDSLEDISQDLLIEVIGSRKPILFCEGDKTGYDYKIYEILFGSKYTIIPTGNCINVMGCVESCNKLANRGSIQRAIGIVDSDLKSQEEKDRLNSKQIYTLKCNEIEMILIDEIIFKKVLSHVFKNEDVHNVFKDKFFQKLEERKDYIIRRIVKTKVDEKLHSSIIDDRENQTKEALINNLNNIRNEIDIDKLWESSDAILTRIISNREYDLALQYCCLEHKEIINGLCNLFIPDYANLALGILKCDVETLNAIKMKYFSDFSL